jgi:hypothetical protein
MTNFIKLTSHGTQKDIFINPDMIGHIYERTEKTASQIIKTYTKIGIITHNNGGFEVTESVEEVLKLISQSQLK